MHNIALKQKVIGLRENGNSIKDIADNFNLSKSTVSLWCKDVFLSKEAQDKIIKKSKSKLMAGMLRYSENKRKERIERIDKNKKLELKRWDFYQKEIFS